MKLVRTRSCRHIGTRLFAAAAPSVIIALGGAGMSGCTSGADAARALPSQAELMTTTTPYAEPETADTLYIALNEHLHAVLARSSVVLDPAHLGDAATVMITEPTAVVYDDPRAPRLGFRLHTGRFVAIDQAAGWVYGLTVTPQLRATPIGDAVAAAREVERVLDGTAWRRDASAPWRTSDDTVRVWLQTADDELPVARYTSGTAEVRITLKRTGALTPSDRLRGKTAETFFVNVGITDMAHLDAYQARVIRARRARGNPSSPVSLAAFMTDTIPP